MQKINPKEHDRRIATFEEVLKLLNEPDKKHVWLHFEVKVPSVPLIAKTKELLDHYKMRGRVIWGCVPHQWNEALYKCDPKYPRNCSKSTISKIIVGYLFGFLPFLPIE